jgi:hypothetical protein
VMRKVVRRGRVAWWVICGECDSPDRRDELTRRVVMELDAAAQGDRG